MESAEKKVAPRKDTIWSPSYIALMAANFFSSMAMFMSSTTTPLFMDSLGVPVSTIGLTVAVFFMAAVIVRPFAGPAYDSFSKKKFFIIAECFVCLSIGAYGLCTSAEMMLVLRIVHGTFGGAAIPLAMALVADTLPSTKFASGISIYTLAQSVAQVIGPATGLWLIEVVGYSGTYFLSAGCLAVALCGLSVVKEVKRERLPYQFKLNRMFAKEAVSKAAVIALFMISFSCVNSYIVLYGNLRGIENMGLYFSVYALCLIATRTVYGRAADTLGVERVLLFGVTFFGISFVLLSWMHDFPSLMVVAVVSSLGAGACIPLAQTLALSSVPPERRGAASNTSYMGMDLGQFAGPVLGGLVVEALEPTTGSLVEAYSSMYLVMIIPIAIALAVVVYWNIRKTK